MADTIAEIKSRLDIVEVVSGYVKLVRAGAEYKGLCPFHAEKTPSFGVSQAKQAWFCFGCDQGGDVLAFVQRIENVEFRQALEMLAERAGVELERSSGSAGKAARRRRERTLQLNARAQAYFSHVLWATAAGAPGREMLAERGVSEEVARRFGLGFAPAGGGSGDALLRYLASKAAAGVDDVVDAGLAHPARGGAARDRFRHRLIFPIRDERGSVLAFGARALGDATPKYLNSPETGAYHKSAAIFGIDLAREDIAASHSAVVVEGYFDVIAAHTAGVRNVVASSGTSLTREQVRHLARNAQTIVLCFDFDDAGRAAASRAVDVISGEGLQCRIVIAPGDHKDPDEVVRQDPALFAQIVAAAPPEWQVLLDRALGDAEGGSVDARRAAAERAVTLLARIPEATTRELYVQQAARRLDLGVSSLLADLRRNLRDGAAAPVRTVMARPDGPPPEPSSEPHPTDTLPAPAWEVHLCSLVVNRPSLAATLTSELGLQLDELSSPAVRRILEVASSAGTGVYPLHLLNPHEQRLAAAMLLRDLPELAENADPAELDRALHDCVRMVREAGLRRSLATIQHELDRAKDEGRDDEVELLATRLLELAAETPRLRRTLSAR